MSTPGQSNELETKHPYEPLASELLLCLNIYSYLTGNFAPVTKTWSPTPVTWTGEIPDELLGGMYVRNGGNPVTNSDLGREAHWFDGDGMLSGVWFDRTHAGAQKTTVKFVNQFILTDVYLSAMENNGLQTPILPSISTLVNPASSLVWIIWRILRSVVIVVLSCLAGSQHAIRKISVANTGIHFHDGRALASCESGPPVRVTLPELETVGWYDGLTAEGEVSTEQAQSKDEDQCLGFGGSGPLSWMRAWTTGHPKVDHITGELVLFHCSFAPPFVQYSLIPTSNPITATSRFNSARIVNATVPGCSGGRLMHDFGVSHHHTVILDLPLTLTPLNLLQNKPILFYDAQKPARFGVFPRRRPDLVRWFESSSCCVFHTANTWDEWDYQGNPVAVNMLLCRLTSASLVFSAGDIVPPPHPDSGDAKREPPMSFFAPYDNDDHVQDPEKMMDEGCALLGQEISNSHDYGTTLSKSITGVPISLDDEEQCRLYYYRFLLSNTGSNVISHQFALSVIPFEFPTVSPLTSMGEARYIYGCSTAVESFGAGLGKATKIDVLVRMDVKALLARADHSPPEAVTGCVDERSVDQILASQDPDDPIKAFRLPRGHYGQEASFVPRRGSDKSQVGSACFAEDNGYLLFYVFNEDQLDEAGECRADAKSELWVLDARTMKEIVCKIHLPTRIPYGLHGNWFTEEQIASQRGVASLRSVTNGQADRPWQRMRRKLIRSLG